MSVCSLFLLLAAAICAAGGILARQATDYRAVSQPAIDGSTDDVDEDSGRLPLLDEVEGAEQTAASHEHL